jgi:hypothetical protein
MIEVLKQAAEDVSKAYDVLAFAHTERALELLAKTRTSLRQAIAELESQEPYALEALMYSNDRIKVDPVTGNVSIGTPQRTEQEPVAWGVFEGNLHDMFFSQEEAQEMAELKGTHSEVRPLYATPQRKPLTDEQIGHDPIFRAGVRFAEASHGIKE